MGKITKTKNVKIKIKNGFFKGEKNLNKAKTVYKESYLKRTFGQKFSERASNVLGSWKYLIFQTLFILVWIALNHSGIFGKWDEYPFIFLNFALSVMAAYTAPVILMSQNRESDRDRKRSIVDLATDRSSERKIKDVQKTLIRLEEKLDKMIEKKA